MIRGLEFVSRGLPGGGCPLRNSGTLTIESNSAIRVTGGKTPGDSSVNYSLGDMVTTYLQEIPQRIR